MHHADSTVRTGPRATCPHRSPCDSIPSTIRTPPTVAAVPRIRRAAHAVRHGRAPSRRVCSAPAPVRVRCARPPFARVRSQRRRWHRRRRPRTAEPRRAFGPAPWSRSRRTIRAPARSKYRVFHCNIFFKAKALYFRCWLLPICP